MRDSIYTPRPKTTYADYLEFEEKSQTKHEFCGNEIRAMAGGTPKHARLATNFLVRLGVGLDGQSCQPINSDQRVRVEATADAFYPDAIVSCPPQQFSPFDRNALTNPTLILEVLSPATRRYDRSAKFAAYSQIQSLRDIIFLETEFVQLEHFHRENAAQEWQFRGYFRREDRVRIESLGIELALEEIYRGVEATNAIMDIGTESADTFASE
jgi:Uma2 family endonuclease